ncbi:hypothetical protein OTU49_005891, partial [Cherax quadricarinatus]
MKETEGIIIVIEIQIGQINILQAIHINNMFKNNTQMEKITQVAIHKCLWLATFSVLSRSIEVELASPYSFPSLDETSYSPATVQLLRFSASHEHNNRHTFVNTKNGYKKETCGQASLRVLVPSLALHSL